jgi:hypothetical protein
MTSDPFHPPNNNSASPAGNLALLVQLGVISIIQSFLLSFCCGILGVLIAWMLPVTCVAWGAFVWQSKDSSEEERRQGRLGAILGLAGLATIPVAFMMTMCIGMTLGAASALLDM